MADQASINRRAKSLRDFATRFRDSGYALVEQGSQSALNFITMFLISRFCGLEALGVYAMGRFLMLLLGGMQNSLVSFPYTLFFRRSHQDEAEEFAGSHLILCLYFGLMAGVGFLAIASTCNWLSPSTANLSSMYFGVAIATPLYLIREFSRRHEFAHLRTSNAMWLAVLGATLQLGGLLLLHSLDQLTVFTAFLLVGLSCLLPNIVWFVQTKSELSFSRKEVASVVKKNWVVGKWIFSTQTVMDLLLLSIQSMLVLLVDQKAGGVFAACFAVVSLCNPIVRGLSNLLAPRFAKIYAESSKKLLSIAVKKETLRFVGVLLLLGIVIVFLGEHLVQLFYDKPIQHLAHVLIVLSASMLFQAAGLPAFHALNTIEEPRKAFLPRLAGGMLAAIFLLAWGAGFRELGAAYGLLIANIIITSLTLYRFLASNQFDQKSELKSA